MATTNEEREMRVAVDRIVGFATQFDEAHLNLACHAAFPLVLTPDLLYQIWAHFVPEAPWTAVARVLLSRLCRQVGYEMYEIDIVVRNLLLKELKEYFGQGRFDELGAFLTDYVAQRLTEDEPDTQNLAQAQEWTALAYTKPDEAARQLAEALSSRVKQEDMAEVFRLASLVETFAEPLTEAGFEPLLVYSRGMENFIRDDIAGAAAKFGQLPRQEYQLQIAGVVLQIPREIIKFRNRDRSGHYTTLRTLIDNADILKSALRNLGINVKTNAEVRGNTPRWVRADVVAVLEGDCDLGWSRNSGGTFDLICDLRGVNKKSNHGELINSINQKYGEEYLEYLDDSEVRKNYLASLDKPNISEEQKGAIFKSSACWLQAHPEDSEFRAQYLAKIEQHGKAERKRQVIDETATWLQSRLDDLAVRQSAHTLKASQQGLIKIKRARSKKGWVIDDERWLMEASKVLDPKQNWEAKENYRTGFFAEGISAATWKRFLFGKNFIKADSFQAFCQVLGLNWEELVARSPMQEPLYKDNSNVLQQYLLLVEKHGTAEQRQEAISQTAIWVERYPENLEVRKQYLSLIEKYGTAVVKWNIHIATSAQEIVSKLDRQTRIQIAEGLKLLEQNPLSANLDIAKIKGKSEGVYSFRIGRNWRVVYQLKSEGKVIQVLNILSATDTQSR